MQVNETLNLPGERTGVTPILKASYDATGLRTQVTRETMRFVSPNLVTRPETTSFLYDANETLIGESNETNSEVTGYIYFGNQKIAKLVKRPNQPDQLYFYFNDTLGTPLSIYFADSSNPPRQTSSATPQEGMTSLRKDLIFNTYQLDPYGNLEREEEHKYFHTKEFTGKQMDLNFENLLGYLHHRYYEPDSKLFLSTDPPRPKPEEPFSSNPYIYCLNNPLKYIDPDGRLPADQLMWNVNFASNFGYRRHPILGTTRFHKGIDISNTGANLGVHAAAKGKVLHVGFDPEGWGNFIVLQHSFQGKTVATLYGHLQQRPGLGRGAFVNEGDVLGLMGATV